MITTSDFLPGNLNMFSEVTELWNTVEGYDNLTHQKFSPEFVSSFIMNSGVDFNEDIILVRRSDGKLSAFGMLLYSRDVSKLRARIILMVRPISRGQGIGSKILKTLLERAENNGSKEVACRIPDFRLYVLKFVEKYGFCKSHSRIKMRNQNITSLDNTNKVDGLIIRTIDIQKELGLWVSLQNDIFREDTTYTEITINSMKRIIQNKNFNGNLAVLGVLDTTPVGYCVGWPYNPTSTSSNTILRIEGLGVYRRFRRRGYGKSLICEVLRRGLEFGYHISELLVGETNEAAIHLYQELGFREKFRFEYFNLEL